MDVLIIPPEEENGKTIKHARVRLFAEGKFCPKTDEVQEWIKNGALKVVLSDSDLQIVQSGTLDAVDKLIKIKIEEKKNKKVA